MNSTEFSYSIVCLISLSVPMIHHGFLYFFIKNFQIRDSQTIYKKEGGRSAKYPETAGHACRFECIGVDGTQRKFWGVGVPSGDWQEQAMSRHGVRCRYIPAMCILVKAVACQRFHSSGVGDVTRSVPRRSDPAFHQREGGFGFIHVWRPH